MIDLSNEIIIFVLLRISRLLTIDSHRVNFTTCKKHDLFDLDGIDNVIFQK